MRINALAIVISSILLGSAAAHANPTDASSQSQQAQATAQTDTSRPATTSASPDADTATGTSSTGSMDHDESTRSTTSTTTTTSSTTGSSDRMLMSPEGWADADANSDGHLSQTELTTAAPTLSATFTAIDSNADAKLTRDEFKAWHDTQSGRMEADQPTSSDGSRSSSMDSSSSTTDTSSSTRTTTEPASTGQ